MFEELTINAGGKKPELSNDTRSLVERFPAAGLPRFIKAEANLLRLPLFALGTKHLRTLDGIECRGRITRGGETHQFIFRATRNTSTLYPGPLARSAHLAFQSIITEHGLPFENPVTWGWRDLCRRMGVVYSGRMVQELKGAILATALLGLQSEYALYSKPDGFVQAVERELGERYLYCDGNAPLLFAENEPPRRGGMSRVPFSHPTGS